MLNQIIFADNISFTHGYSQYHIILCFQQIHFTLTNIEVFIIELNIKEIMLLKNE